jgi:hypothetical protein
MIGALPAQGWEVSEVRVQEPRLGPVRRVDLPLPDDSNDEDVYPTFSNHLPFSVDWVNVPFSMSRRCLVELTRPVEPADVQAVADRVELWGALLLAKGFALPSELPLEEIESFLGDVTQFDECTIEISVDRFQACATAWAVLVNLLDSYSRTGVGVAKVIVE